jgi:hypothetical protein
MTADIIELKDTETKIAFLESAIVDLRLELHQMEMERDNLMATVVRLCRFIAREIR